VEYVKNGIGRSARFHGAKNQGYVRIPNSASLQFADSATFSCWFRVENESGFSDNGQIIVMNANQAILSKGGDRQGVAMLSIRARTAKSGGVDKFFDRRISYVHKNFKSEAAQVLFMPRKTPG
jgi:hypothetical protein